MVFHLKMGITLCKYLCFNGKILENIFCKKKTDRFPVT